MYSADSIEAGVSYHLDKENNPRMNRDRILSFRALLAGLMLVVLLTGCSGEPASQWLRAPGWSRGVYTGLTYSTRPVPVTLDDSGGIYLLHVDQSGENYSPRLTAFDRQGQVRWVKRLDQSFGRISDTEIIWDGQGLQAFWIADNVLYRVRLDNQGSVREAPRPLSGEIDVDSFAAARLPSDEVSVWFSQSRREPGLYRLTTEGEVVLVDPQGTRPELRVGADGSLHVIWAQMPLGYGDMRILYASYPQGVDSGEQAVLLYEQSITPTSIVEGPWLGLAGEQVYVIWALTYRTGPQAGTSLASFVYFPAGNPDQVTQPEVINIPEEYRLEYHEVSAGVHAGSRVPLPSPYTETTTISNLSTNTSAAPELVVAFHTQAQYLMRQYKGQVSTAFIQDGKPTGYQLLSFTATDSDSPVIISDAQGYLYLTWMEKGAEGNLVYLATTAPDMVAAMNRLSAEDVGRLAAETLFGMLIGVAISPLAGFIWLMGALVGMLLTTPLRRGNNRVGVIVSIFLSLAAFWLAKYIALPGVESYVPFSAWIPMIPDWLKVPLQIVVPVMILITALYVAWSYTFRRESESVLNFLLIYAAVDAVLSMAVYGVIIISAF